MLRFTLAFAVKSMLIAVCSSLSSLGCFAQTINGSGFSAESTSAAAIHKLVQEVDLTFTVRNHWGHLVRNLTPEQVAILDNGESPKKITYFESQARLPLRLAFVIDISDSVASELKDEKDAAQEFLRGILRPATDLGLVITFNENAHLVQEPTSEVHRLTRAFTQLPAGGETAIYDAVVLAAHRLASIPDYRPSLKVVILMSDGDDNCSHITLHDAGMLAEQEGSTIYALNTSPFSPDGGAGERAMRWLAGVTGGNYLSVDPEGIGSALLAIQKELRSLYAISYKPRTAEPDGSFHKVSIIVPKKMSARHRDGYFAR